MHAGGKKKSCSSKKQRETMTSSPSAKTLSRLREPSSSVTFGVRPNGMTVSVTGNSVDSVKRYLQDRSTFSGEKWTVEPGKKATRFHGPRGVAETLVHHILDLILDREGRAYDHEDAKVNMVTTNLTYTWYAHVDAKRTLTF